MWDFFLFLTPRKRFFKFPKELLKRERALFKEGQFLPQGIGGAYHLFGGGFREQEGSGRGRFPFFPTLNLTPQGGISLGLEGGGLGGPFLNFIY